MINIQSFNRIIFYGCSFTAGAELADLELFPNLTQEEITKLKIKLGNPFYNQVDPIKRESLEKPKAWGKWFCDELKLGYENRAVSGSSLDQIIFNIEYDLANDNILDTDLVIVGITTPERLCIFDKHNPISLILHNMDNRWISDSFRNDFIKYIASDDYILFNYFKNVKYLDMLSNQLNGRLFLQWIWATPDEIFMFHHGDVTNKFYNLNEYVTSVINKDIKFEHIIDNNVSFTTLNSWSPENQLEFNHPKLHIQQNFGRMLAQSFLKKQ